MSTEIRTGNTTNKLLAVLIALVALLTLLSAANLHEDSQPWHAPTVSGADSVGYAINNPTLQEDLHARIMAPAIKQNTVGAR